MSHTAMQCSQCGARVVEPRGSDQSECPFCEATTLLVPADGTTVPARKLARNEAVDLSRFTIDVDGPDLELQWRWDRLKGWLGIPVAGFFGWYGGDFCYHSLGSGVSSSNAFERWLPFLLGLGVIAGAIGFGYLALAAILNSTSIAIRDRVLQTSHGPLPFYPGERLPLSSLDELRVHREVTTDSDGDTNVEFQLHACTRSGCTINLIVHEKTSEIPRAVKSVLDAHIRRLAETPVGVVDPSNPGAPRRTAPHRRKVLLICPGCGGLARAPRKFTSSRCRHCGEELTIPDEVWASVGLHPPRRRNIEHEPVTFVLRREGPALVISAGWNRNGCRVLLAIGLFFVGVATSGILLALRNENWSLAELATGGSEILVIGSLLLGVWASRLAYVALCHLFNRTVVSFDADRVRVWNGPLPLRRSCELPTGKITQISIRRSYCPYVLGSTPCYSLDAISDYGGTLELFFAQPELKGLQTLERLLERRLNLADRFVEGEV